MPLLVLLFVLVFLLPMPGGSRARIAARQQSPLPLPPSAPTRPMGARKSPANEFGELE